MGLSNMQEKLENERYATSKKRLEKCSKCKKKFGPAWTPGTPVTKGPRSRGPGRTGPRDLEGPVVCQDGT